MFILYAKSKVFHWIWLWIFSDPCDDSPCKNGGQCAVDSNQDAVCVCPDGFIGPTCSLLASDPCGTMECGNGNCAVFDGDTPLCVCSEGFSGPKCDVQSPDVCHPSPCLNGGSCAISNGDVVCICLLGFTGTTCESVVVSTSVLFHTRICNLILGKHFVQLYVFF